MLNETLDHGAAPRRIRLVAIAGLVAAALAVASAHVAQGRISGVVVDETARSVPGVTVVVMHESSEAIRRVVTDSEGRYEIADLPAGIVRVTAAFPGFVTHRATVTASEGAATHHDVTLRLGSIEETVYVARNGAPPARPAGAPSTPPERPCMDGGAGGQLREPRKVAHVPPRYPASLADAGVAGIVEIDATVDTDGRVTGTTVVSDPHPELTRAALDALRQWQYSPTLLNCAAVPVRLGVRVTFGDAASPASARRPR